MKEDKRPKEQPTQEPSADAVEIIDIEAFAKENGGKPPAAKRYEFRIDREKYKVEVSSLLGRELLQLAGKTPTERWMLNAKLKGGQVRAIGLDDRVDLTEPGLERFITLPKDQTEGRESTIRQRQFPLPEEDADLLDANNYDWETVVEGGNRWLIIHSFTLPYGYTTPVASVGLSISSGYPSAALDMAYFHPPVARADGQTIRATATSATIQGQRWQRWSRHYTGENPWKMGEYNTFTHLQLVHTWLEREIGK
jgi:hypothetical protein